MASSEDMSFNAACFRVKAQMSNLGAFTAAAAPPNSHREDGGFGGESLVVVRKLERRRGLLDIDLNVAPPEAADCELAAAEGGGNGLETPPAEESAKKAEISDEEEANFNAESETGEISADAEAKVWNRRWIALLGVAESALLEKKAEEIRRGEEAAAAANRRRNCGQRRHSLVEEWNNNGEVVVRSTRGRAVAMPSKYRDSVLGSAAAAVAELPRQSRNGKSATVFCTKRKSR